MQESSTQAIRCGRQIRAVSAKLPDGTADTVEKLRFCANLSPKLLVEAR